MLLEINNNSAPSGFLWEPFDFEGCVGHEWNSYIWAVCTMLCFALGFPASIAILLEIVKTYRRGTPFTPNDFFILNLSIMDTIFLASIPCGLLNHFIWKNWPFEACWNGIYALNTCGRPLLMACICLDCYIAVVHPVVYHKRKSLTPRVVIVAIVWAFTVVSGILYFLFYKLYYSMFPTVTYIIAMVIIGVCDSFILHALVKSGPGRNDIHPQKQRAIQTLINSLIMTAISYLPPIFLLSIVSHLSISINTVICIVATPITVTAALGAAVMPVLHLNNHGKLDRFKLGCCRKC